MLGKRMTHFPVFLALFAALLAAPAVALVADCGNTCDVNAYCDLDATNASVCSCQPGMIDSSSGATGTSCDTSGWAVRYVYQPSQPPPMNPTAVFTSAEGMSWCPTSGAFPAQGYFLRSLASHLEVNCLYAYSNKPGNVSDYTGLVDPMDPSNIPSFEGSGAESSVGIETRRDLTLPTITFVVEPAIYVWNLPTTSKPLYIPPTGLTVDSVHFKPNCSETGCWVLKGVLTTGEAFNDYSAFNTFFLPQADITAEHPAGDISYDYDYSAVEWTFAPANHPCTSAAYDSGSDETLNPTFKVSTCCITDEKTDSDGGFIANYRPTEAFVEWAGGLACDAEFTTVGGSKDCYKVYTDFKTWDDAVDVCENAGGKLAVIENADQQEDIAMVLERKWGSFYSARVRDDGDYRAGAWINLKDEYGNGSFAWANENPANFDAWSNNQPEENSDKRCVTASSWVGKWYNMKCTGKAQFVCQFTLPEFNDKCVAHVIQRPKYTAPPKKARKCWDVYGTVEATQTVIDSTDSDDSWANGAEDTWSAAQAFCEKDGGYLARVESDEDVTFMGRFLEAQGISSAWIGARLDDATFTSSEGAETEYYWGANATTSDEVIRLVWAIEKDWCTKPSQTKNCIQVRGADFGKVCTAECNPPKGNRFICEYPREVKDTCLSDNIENQDQVWDVAYPLHPHSFLDVGKFKGMNASPGVVAFDNIDPFFGQFSFEIHLDEVELRSKAGKLRGTVGVEHTVDTFLGLNNFRPTGTDVVDTFATQTNIHLEKTSFFSVSTHGVNDYTFLEYVNMRLVMILNEDADFSGEQDTNDGAGDSVTNNLGDSESTNRTLRTDRSGNAAYVQVTFTMGTQYQPNLISGGLVPLDSVRAGMGTFFDDAATNLEHVCTEWDDANATLEETFGLSAYGSPSVSFEGQKKTFIEMLAQPCAPQSTMCKSPDTVPDQFVSFNIPLGFEVFDGMASNDLSNNIFVEFIVNAVDTVARGAAKAETNPADDPNDGGEPWQMKTTLTASIPIVDGGINIFCDGITAKTDLKDVANVDIVVGTAVNASELTRLRILEDIASTDLDQVPSSQIDTDSIESALMTLVIKGNESYFLTGATNTFNYAMELDDVITLHLMEDGDAGSVTNGISTNGKETEVIRLLALPGDDNQDSNGLDTDGYYLNGAFRFRVARGEGRAHLEPSASLLAVCPFNPPRPTGSNPLESCILRRDVNGRTYPARAGSQSTAMEILACSRIDSNTQEEGVQATLPQNCDETMIDTAAAALGSSSAESTFLTRILGNSDYTKALAPDFARAIHERYQLNGRFRRAYWINPGYEWTPTQTAGKSIFSVSQKIYLFALVSLDENWTARRRMLLQTTSSDDPLAENDSGMNQAKMEFQVTPISMMANAFDVPVDRVALFDLEMQLTSEEACKPSVELQDSLRDTLEDHLSTTASTFHTVQVVSMSIDMGDEVCAQGNARRNIRKLLAGFSSATAAVKMLIVFHEGTQSTFDLEKFATMAGINAVVPDARNSPKVTIGVPPGCDNGGCGKKEETSDSDSDSSVNVALIGGVVGGVAGVGLLGAGAWMFARNQRDPAPVMAVQSINVEDLKSQLSADL